VIERLILGGKWAEERSDFLVLVRCKFAPAGKKAHQMRLDADYRYSLPKEMLGSV
jgi:hypothetical protein